MKCPYCEQSFALTWKRYFSSPLGKHRCPHCQQQSRLNHSSTYYTAILLLLIVLLGLGALIPMVYLEVSAFRFYSRGYNWAWGYGVMVIFLVLDRLFDERLRVLEKLPQRPESENNV